MHKSIISVFKKNNYFYFILLLLLSFGVYWKTFQLSLYGDDWLAISKFLQFGKTQGYLNPSIYITNYGFQNWIGIAYLLFGNNFTPYFAISLLSRAVLGYVIFYITKKVYSTEAGVIAGFLFVASSIGAETTDWVYNVNSYWGIALAVVGLAYFIDAKDRGHRLKSWVLILSGYIIAIIRLYILPLLIPLLVFIKNIHSVKILRLNELFKILLKSTVAIIPFLVLKLVFPGLGFQGINKKMLQEGISNIFIMVNEGRFDWMFSPFTNLGNALIPVVFEKLQTFGWSVYPVSQFLVYGAFLFFLGFLLIYISNNKPDKSHLVLSILASLGFLIVLKLFAKYQGAWGFKEFAYFSWTFVGVISVFVFIFNFIKEYKSNNSRKMVYLAIGLVFTFSFLFPWLYNPGYLFGAIHRYMILTAVGLVMLLSVIYDPFSAKRKLLKSIRVVFLTVFVLLQVINVNLFFGNQVEARPKHLYYIFYNQIKQQVPKLPEDKHSVFYFENVEPAVYEQLIRFGFGFHMQLFYGLEYNEQIFPYTVSSIKDLEKAASDDNFDRKLGYSDTTRIDHIYAFRLQGDKLINITDETRDYLRGKVK